MTPDSGNKRNITTTNAENTSGFGNPYRFTGRRYDIKAGIYYYRNRYYEPVTGRFLSRDPGTYIDSPNLYVYVNGNVPNLKDPSGLYIILDNTEPNYGQAKKVFDEIAKLGCMKVRVHKVENIDDSVALEFVEDKEARKKFDDEVEKSGKCCDCSKTLGQILENANTIRDLYGATITNGLPSSNPAMNRLGVSVSRPGKANTFLPATPAMQTIHEMTHFMPKGEGKLSDSEVIRMVNKIREELCIPWERVVDHAIEEFVNAKTGKKVSIDTKGNLKEVK